MNIDWNEDLNMVEVLGKEKAHYVLYELAFGNVRDAMTMLTDYLEKARKEIEEDV